MVFVLFWSATIASLILSPAGIFLGRPGWLRAGAALILPLALYLSMTPRFRFFGLLLPLFQLAAAVAVQRRASWAAWLLLMPLAGFFGWLASAASPQQPPLPLLSVVRALAGQAEVPTVRGSYCWRGLSVGECVDTISPPELLKTGGITPTVLPAGSTLRITFDLTPKADSVRVNQWIQGNPQPVPVTPEGTFAVPQDPGVYIYDVSAQWNQGDASYAFWVEVK